MKITIGGKLEGTICSYCGASDVWFTEYLAFFAANVECRSCGGKWVECPETKLHVTTEEEALTGIKPFLKKWSIHMGYSYAKHIRGPLMADFKKDLEELVRDNEKERESKS